MSREISYAEAVAKATEAARDILRALFPEDETAVFESRVINADKFWLFFRNRKIRVPAIPDGKFGGNFAFAIGKHGLVLLVRDNFEDEDRLDEQLGALNARFAEKDQGDTH